jgi:hypothetical protein
MRAGDLVVNIVGWVDSPVGEMGVLLEDPIASDTACCKVKVLFPAGVRHVYCWEVDLADDFRLLLGVTR